MANRVTIEPTEFKNVRSGKSTLGVRVYDEHGQAYDNTWEAIPDDDLDILEKALECTDNAIAETLSFVQENETGIYIGETWYDWDEIKDCFQ